MLKFRLFVGALGVGFISGAHSCYTESQAVASHAVASVLFDNALAMLFIGAVLLTVSLLCDHRTASQIRTANRRKHDAHRMRNRYSLDAHRYQQRSRNRF